MSQGNMLCVFSCMLQKAFFEQFEQSVIKQIGFVIVEVGINTFFIAMSPI